MRKPLKAFITYAHKNRKAKDKLIECLKGMRSEGLIRIWHDNEIIAGDKWRDEIFDTNLPDSDLLLYLVSASSLDSENCNRELGIALEKNIRLILIILEDCDWKNYKLSNVQTVSTEDYRFNEWASQKLSDIHALPAEGKPLNEWNPRSKGWQSVVDGLREAIQTLHSPAESALQQGNFWITLNQIDKAIETYSRAIEINRNYPGSYNNRGAAYMRQGKIHQALHDFSTAIDLDPNYADAYYNRGNSYFDIAEFNRAMADFTKAIILDSEYSHAYNNRGLIFIQQKKFDLAIEDFNKTIELNPALSVAYYNRGGAYYEKREYDRAIDNCTRAIQLEPDSSVAYHNRALTYVKKGEYECAIADYTRALELNPKDISTYNDRGNAYRYKADYCEAIKDYDKAITLNPDYAGAYVNRGIVYGEKGEIERAIEDYDRAIKLEPNDAKAYNNRGLAYVEKHEYDRAIEDYNCAIERNPKYAIAFYHRGTVYYKKEEFIRAIEDYNRAILLNPKFVDAYNNRGIAKNEKGDNDGAIADYTMAADLKHDYSRAYYNRGRLFHKMDKFDPAISDFAKLIELKPDDADAYFCRGNVYAEKGEYTCAIADFTKVLDIKPDDAQAYILRGSTYYLNYEYSLAIADFTKAIELNPENAQTHCNRGVVFGKQRLFNKAINDYSTAIKLNPDLAIAYCNRGEARLHLSEWEKAKLDLLTAREKGLDIVASFRNDYESVSDFERSNRVKVPDDISDMLTQPRRSRFPKTQRFLRSDGTPFESPDVVNLLATLRNAGTPLSDYIQTRPSFGIKIGASGAFVVDSATRDRLIAEHASSVDILKPFLHGQDIRRWQVARPDAWLIFTYRRIEINRYPAVRKHLEKYRSPLNKRAGKQKWYELPAAKRDADRFTQTKLICPNSYDHQTFAVDTEGLYCGDTCYLIPTEETWLCGLLNSRVVEWYYSQASDQLTGDYLRARSRYLQQIPVPDLTPTQKSLIGKIVDYLIYLQGQPTTSGGDLAHARDFIMLGYFERIVDGLVYESYLSEELHQGEKHFFKPLLGEGLPNLEEIRGDKMPALREIFERLYERTHPVRSNLFFLDSVKPIRIIEDKA